MWIEVKDGNFMERAFGICKEESFSERGFRIYREGHFIENVLKCVPRLAVSFMVIGLIAVICEHGIEYFPGL